MIKKGTKMFYVNIYMYLLYICNWTCMTKLNNSMLVTLTVIQIHSPWN